jgi:hypothetical protein
MAEEHMRRSPTKKCVVILPARLRSNFIYELMSACSNYAYITREDSIAYGSSQTPKSVKKTIFDKFIAAISRKYTVMSFERLRLDAMKSKSPRDYLKKLVHDKVVLIDEVHNLINPAYKQEHYETIDQGKVPKIKSISAILTILLKVMVNHSSANTNFIYLTGTPIVDNTKQFGELCRIINPIESAKINMTKNTPIESLVPLLAGHISYFPGSSQVAFPSVTYESHLIEPSVYQHKLLMFIRELGDEDNADADNLNNAFLSLERRASIFAYIGDQGYKFFKDDDAQDEYHSSFEQTFKRAMRTPSKYMPKVELITRAMDKLPGKHLLYSSFVQLGGAIIGRVLSHRGWVNIKDVLSGKTKNPSNHKCYAFWDGVTTDAEKEAIKSIANSIDNIDGKLLKVIIGSPAIKEGVSFKHIQHYHILDPLWNQSTKMQVEGRAVRFCSHFDIPDNHPFLKRSVIIHIYKIEYPLPDDPIERAAILASKKLPFERSIDTHIYDYVIPRKYEGVRRVEALLRKVAFDYYLFRKLYKKNVSSVPSLSKSSQYDLSDESDAFMVNVKKPKGLDKKRKTNTCLPKNRRPPCKVGFEQRVTKNGNECCYKIRKVAKAKTKATCPAKRRPPCVAGYDVRKNKHGDDCCYKSPRA